jgi:Ser/Thr protein kinase RdoA (MazF antagonist)
MSNPQRIRIEANGLRWLNRAAPQGATPLFLWEDRENGIMAMEEAPAGHEDWKSQLLAGNIRRQNFQRAGSLLGIIHRQSNEEAEEVRSSFDVTEYFESLRLEPYYVYTAHKIPASKRFLHDLINTTRLTRLSLVHGDFSPKNILVYPSRLIILDYEVIHFGDPAFDVGFALSHLLSKAHHLPECRRALIDGVKLFWSAYCNEIHSISWAGRVEARAVRHTLACLLARVAGKSPLEYLTKQESLRQLQLALTMMSVLPHSIGNLVEEFAGKIS